MYSFSQLQLFAQCPRKYQFRYIDKIEKEFESSADLILGHSVHAVLENLYNKVNTFIVPSLEEVVQDFHDIRNKELAEATKDKELQIKWDNKLEDYIRRGEYYVKAYYEKFAPFENIKVIGTELSLIFDLDAGTNPPATQASGHLPCPQDSLRSQGGSNKKFRGYVDRIDKEGDTFIINDYKTGKKLPPEQKEEYIEQLTLYGLGVQQKYAKYFKHLKARLFYLHFDLVDEREITDANIQAVVKKYSDLIEQVEHKKFSYNMWDKKSFEPVQSNQCDYCEYKSICPLRAHLKYDDEVVGWELGEKTIKWLVDEYVMLARTESDAKGQKEAIKEILVDYLQNKWLLKLFWTTGKISASQLSNISIKDKDKLREVLDKLGLLNEAMEIDRFKVQKFVKEGKLPIEKVEWSIEKSDSRSLRVGDM